MPEGYIVPEPFDELRINSASGIPSILDKAFKGELWYRPQRFCVRLRRHILR
jgi:hypothetical protein